MNKSLRFGKSLVAILLTFLMTFSLLACVKNVEEEKVKDAVDSISIIFGSGDGADRVTRDLNLPTSFGDVAITWKSSNTSAISNTGVVTRAFSDVTVILTAEATLGQFKAQKEFVLKVLAIDVQAALDAITLTGNITYDSALELYTAIGNINLAQASQGLNITWVSSIPAVITNAGVVNRPAYGENSASVTLIASINNVERVFEIIVPASTEAPDETLVTLNNAKNNLLLNNVNDGVTQNIILPLVVGTEGVTVTWSSSNPAILSNTGAVIRQDDNVTVVLTATLHLNSQSVTKEFELVVLAAADYIVVENIADAIEISRSGDGNLSYTRTYVRIPDVTIIGITGDGVAFADASGIFFAYMGSRRSDLVVGDVYDVRGLTDRFFGSWQLNNTAVPSMPVVFTPSDGDVTVVNPVEVGSVTEMIANQQVPTSANPDINYVYYRVTAKVLVQNAADNYGTVFVNADYDGPAIPTAANSAHTDQGVIVYYHSNKAAFDAFHNQVITFNIMFYGYRSDRSIFSTLYLEGVENIELSVSDQETADIVETTIKADLAKEYFEDATALFRTTLFGASIAWTSDNTDLVDPTTGTITMPEEGQVEVTLVATITKGDVVKEVTIKVLVGELDLLTIDQVLDQVTGTKVRFIGIVTGITTNRTFAIQDETGAIAVYVATADVATWLTYVGKSVEVIASRAHFRGLEQVSPLEVTVGNTASMPAFTNIDAVELTNEALLAYQSKHVSLTGMLVTKVEVLSFGNVQLTLQRPGTDETIIMFWDSRVVVANGNIAAVEEGATVNIVGAPLGWANNNVRLEYSHVSQILVVVYIPETDEEKVLEDAAALDLQETAPQTTTLTLPDTGLYGSTISWISSHPALVNAETGVVVMPEDLTVVTLTATVKLNDAETVVEFEIEVGYVVLTVLEVRNAPVTTTVTVTTEALVVNAWTNTNGTVNAFIQDGTAGIYVFGVPAAHASKVVVGNMIRITGVRAEFREGAQISGTSVVTVLSVDNPVVPLVVSASEMGQNLGKLVTLTAYLAVDGGSRALKLVDLTGETFLFFNTSGDATSLDGVVAGTEVEITGGVGYSFGAQFTIFVPGQITVKTLADRAVLNDLAVANLVLPEADAEVIENLDLPVAGLFGTTVVWTSSNETVISNEGVVTRPTNADAVVTLTYELKFEDTVVATNDIVFTVLKVEGQVDPQPTTVTAAYPGGSTTNMLVDVNNAGLVALDPTLFNVTTAKGQASVEVGLNTSGQIRIYANRSNGDGNTLTVSIDGAYVITSISIVFGASTNSPTAALTLGTETMDLVAADLLNATQLYEALNINTFSLKNTQNTGGSGSNAQIFILSIDITYMMVPTIEPTTVIAAYPGGSTTNMLVDVNNAGLVALDPTLFNVTTAKGQASVEVGLNTSGQIRIYANRSNGDGNTLTVSIDGAYVITSISIVFGASTNSPTAALTLGTETMDLVAADLLNTTQLYEALNINTFSLKNTQNTGGSGSNAQIFILSITITYQEVA